MLEWAVFISTGSDPNELKSLENVSSATELAPFQAEVRALVQQHCGCVEFSRVYWGNEFCQRLIPGLDRLRTHYSAITESGLGFSLVTPYVTNEGLEKLKPLFQFLVEQGDAEVVVNDWGVLNVLRREYPQLKPVLGRLMNKMIRDPRVAQYYDTPGAPREALRALRESSVTAHAYRKLLENYGIEMVELDNLFQGIALHFDQLGLRGSLYIPYGYVATGRVCMIGSLHLPKHDKFCVDNVCRRECLNYVIEYCYSDSPFDNRDQRFFQKGNTVFYTHSDDMISWALLSAPGQGIRRIVYQPQFPMG